MIGLDAIGFHAVAEMIMNIFPPIEYLTPSKPFGGFEANYFQKGVATNTELPTVTTVP